MTISSKEVETILLEWVSSFSSIDLITNWENRVFKIKTPCKDYILRISLGNRRTREDIIRECSWVCYLKDQGVSVPVYLKTRKGELVHSFNKGHAILYVFIEGSLLSSSHYLDRNQTGQLLSTIGANMGGIHNLSNRFYLENSYCQKWHDLTYLHSNLAPSYPEIELIKKKLLLLNRDNNHYGQIHGDIQSRNLVLKEKRVTFLDFDDSCCFFFAYDLAMFIGHLLESTDYKYDFLLDSLLSGYQAKRTISKEFVSSIPFFLSLRKYVYYCFLIEKKRRRSLEEKM